MVAVFVQTSAKYFSSRLHSYYRKGVLGSSGTTLTANIVHVEFSVSCEGPVRNNRPGAFLYSSISTAAFTRLVRLSTSQGVKPGSIKVYFILKRDVMIIVTV